MVYTKNELKILIKDFIKRVKRTIPIEKVILFGSYAWGKPNKYSDIDLAIVSSRFRKMDDIKRIVLLLEVVRKVRMPKLVDIEPLGFTPEELEKADYFDIACEIKERGKVVYSGS